MAGGAPLGNTNAAKAKKWTAAIERALQRFPELATAEGKSDYMKGLDEAADAFVGELMARKDIQFFKEMGDRLEGKAHQSADVNLSGTLHSVLMSIPKSDET